MDNRIEMSDKQFETLITETNRIEYKRELTDDLEKEVVAFLNYKEGGFIYIGIDRNGKTIGVPNADKDMLKIKDRLRTNILPSCLGLFDVCLEEKADKHIIKIIVASGSEKPYYLKKHGMTSKGCYIRIGTAAEPMPMPMIESLFSKRTRNNIRRIKSPRQDLRFEQLKIYYEGAGLQLNDQFAKTLELFTEEKQYNYVAYLLADENIVSIKLAKYRGTDRYDLIENKEYGNCSLIKATKQVLDRLEVENTTFAKITSKERLEWRLWNQVALREAVINAIVHNDYSSEVFPKFEIFDNRIEITSYGTLPIEISKNEFFSGASVPRNKELMRIFRDLELVEYLGSGLPRILKAYGKRSFKFTENFLQIVLPIDKDFLEQKNAQEHSVGIQLDSNGTMQDTMQVTPQDTMQDTMQVTPQDTMQDTMQVTPQDTMQDTMQVTPQDTPQVTPQDTPQVTPQVVELVKILNAEMNRQEIQSALKLLNRENFRLNYLKTALEQGVIEMTIPDKPNSKLQKYRLTPLGLEMKNRLLSKSKT
ncbi:hypothetical protein AGMMS4956_16550 [Bacteroidia bacterium]|nr:hypothetical protein AGMMS4956_16550 [Bacteroidia bacterium]